MTTHANTPKANERTTVRRAKTSAFGLVKATAGAIFFAVAIITFVWLPAEYGIDPTGVGQKLGLKEMGDIKNELHKEADNAELKTVNTSEVSVDTVAKLEESQQNATSAITTADSATAKQALEAAKTKTDSATATQALEAPKTKTDSATAPQALEAAVNTTTDSATAKQALEAATSTADSATATQALEAAKTTTDSATAKQALEAATTTNESEAIAKILETAANETKSQTATQAAATTTNTETAAPVLAAATTATEKADPVLAAATTATDAAAAVSTSVEWRDVKEYRLSSGQAIEVKLTMDEGAVADFSWTANGAVVNHDTHGDGDGQNISYEKGRSVPSQTGQLTAAFKGSHGWFWRNRTSESVVITLRTRGDYKTLYIP